MYAIRSYYGMAMSTRPTLKRSTSMTRLAWSINWTSSSSTFLGSNDKGNSRLKWTWVFLFLGGDFHTELEVIRVMATGCR